MVNSSLWNMTYANLNYCSQILNSLPFSRKELDSSISLTWIFTLQFALVHEMRGKLTWVFWAKSWKPSMWFTFFPFSPISVMTKTRGDGAPIILGPWATTMWNPPLQICNGYVAWVRNKIFMSKSLRLLFYLLL